MRRSGFTRRRFHIGVNHMSNQPGKRFVSALVGGCLLTGTILLGACAPTQSNYEGAVGVGAVGAAAGALIDKGNPWRGAVIGGALGAAAGSSMAEISKRAASEARSYGRPIYYERPYNGGWQRVEAEPRYGTGSSGRCVEIRTFDNGRLVDERLSCD